MSCKCAFQYVENVETMVRGVFFFSEKSKKESQDHHEIGKESYSKDKIRYMK